MTQRMTVREMEMDFARPEAAPALHQVKSSQRSVDGCQVLYIKDFAIGNSYQRSFLSLNEKTLNILVFMEEQLFNPFLILGQKHGHCWPVATPLNNQNGHLETRIGCFLFNPLHPTHHQTYPFTFLLHFVWNVKKCKNSLSLFCKLTFSTITFTMGENLTISWIIDSKPWLWSHKLRTKWFWHSRFFGLLQVVLFSSVFWQWVSGSCRYIFAKLYKV